MLTPDFLAGSAKPKATKRILNEALVILSSFGVPLAGLTTRRLESMAMSFCAVANVRKSGDWLAVGINVHKKPPTTREIIRFINPAFQEKIADASYDDIRRKHLILPVAAGVVLKSAGDQNAARNDGTRGYAVDADFAAVIRRFGDPDWLDVVKAFMADKPTLETRIAQKRPMKMVSVILPSGKPLEFSPGKHNQLQKAVIEEFLPRFGYGSQVLYVGDTADKLKHVDGAMLKELRFFEIGHGELPDIVAYSAGKNWLYLIEAVNSSGPISRIRMIELERLTKECTADIIFVTAFLDRDTFRKFAPDIAWETEVWIADAPDHLIHFNGHNFLGPYKRQPV